MLRLDNVHAYYGKSHVLHGVSIEVRPSLVPDVKVWGGLDRRAMMFERVRRGRNSGYCYCKVALADPAGA